jgi:hypothetical protein
MRGRSYVIELVGSPGRIRTSDQPVNSRIHRKSCKAFVVLQGDFSPLLGEFFPVNIEGLSLTPFGLS